MATDKEIAQQIIDRQDGLTNGAFGINESALSVEMANYVIRTPGVVYWVLVLLQERDYDPTTIIKVTRDFIDQTVQSVFIRIGATRDGKILIQKINQIIKCDAPGNAAARRCLKIQTVIGAGAKPGEEAGKAAKDESAAQPRQLSQVEMDWYAKYNEGKLIFYERDANLVLRSYGGKRNTFDAEVCWKLPEKSNSYVVYNLDDLKGPKVLEDKWGFDQIGTKETIDAMIRIAKEWSVLHPDKKLEYGDVSRPGGINTPDHKTHNNGKAFDMRLLRKGKSDGIGFTYKQKEIYSQELTKEFILFLVKLYPGTTFYFNDSQLNEVDKETRNFVDPSGGHNNHLHVMFPGGN